MSFAARVSMPGRGQLDGAALLDGRAVARDRLERGRQAGAVDVGEEPDVPEVHAQHRDAERRRVAQRA